MKVNMKNKWIRTRDLNTNEILQINTEAKMEHGKFGEQLCAEFTRNGGETGLMAINAASMREMIAAWGDDTVNWIDKYVIVRQTEQNIRGRMMDVKVLMPHSAA